MHVQDTQKVIYQFRRMEQASEEIFDIFPHWKVDQTRGKAEKSGTEHRQQQGYRFFLKTKMKLVAPAGTQAYM
jgi:hypothetical protein